MQSAPSNEYDGAFEKHSDKFLWTVSSTCCIYIVRRRPDQIIGGPGIVVEIDGTKLGKRKYHCGHWVEGAWILVGVERTEERKVFLVHVAQRNAITLQRIIQQHVREGSIVCMYIQTYGEAGYNGLEDNLGLEHHTVNHSLWFRDPITGIHTNTAEGTNNALKIFICPTNRDPAVDGHLCEFIWRRLHHGQLWDAFIEALKDIHYEFE